MERTIRVTGKGKISVKPDTTRLLVTLEDVIKDYAGALEESARRTETVKDTFESLGFERTALRTLSFNIDIAHESYRDKNGNWKERFRGFRFRHGMKVEFPSDNARLGKILYRLAHSDVKPEFRIQYTVADMEACKNELLGRAVADSRSKAEVLTRAVGVRLGQVETIDYSWGEIDIYSEPMGRNMKCMAMEETCCDSIEMDIEPDDIEVSDTVTVVWGIDN